MKRQFIFTFFCLVFIQLVSTLAWANPLIRVRLFSTTKVTNLKLSANHPFILKALASDQAFFAIPGAEWQINLPKEQAEGIELINPEGEGTVVAGPLALLWQEEAQAAEITAEASVEASAAQPFPAFCLTVDSTARRWRGQLVLERREGELILINTLPLEEYLLGVVPAEVPATWPQAALAAQAILARTYALNRLGSTKGYDVVDSVLDQVYRGLDSEKESTSQAVAQTAGLVVGYQGQIAKSVFYFSTCGGFTEDVANIWGGSVPYLKSVVCAAGEAVDLSTEAAARAYLQSKESEGGCTAAPLYRWQVVIPQEELQQILTKQLTAMWKCELQLGYILALRAVKRSPAGRVLELHIETTTGFYILKGDHEIRNVFQRNGRVLFSSFFVSEPEFTPAEGEESQAPEIVPQAFRLIGAGNGHGVGMCQYGTRAMALAGAEPAAIISHFLPGTELLKAY